MCDTRLRRGQRLFTFEPSGREETKHATGLWLCRTRTRRPATGRRASEPMDRIVLRMGAGESGQSRRPAAAAAAGRARARSRRLHGSTADTDRRADDAELVERLRRGEPAARRELVDRHARDLFAFACSLL